jgi:nucleoside phosphorylase
MGELLVDFAIVTAIETERKAVCEAFQMGDADRVRKGVRTYWRKQLALSNNQFYEIVVTQLPDVASVDAALAVKAAIDDWHPGAVLMVGIAGAARESVQPGDVVLGQEVAYYERGKETPIDSLPEPKQYPADATLWDRVISVALWGAPIPVQRPDGTETRPAIHRGVIASVERVIANAATRSEIAANNRKIAAIEMEGYGVSAAAWKQDKPVRCLVIRAISDRADAQKDDTWQPYATAVAAEFTKHFLLDRPLEPRNSWLVLKSYGDLDLHYKLVIEALTKGKVIPFLGEGINLCDRPPNHENSEGWQPGQYPPSDSELASYLVRKFGSPFDATEIQCPITSRDEIPEECPVKAKLGPDEVFTCPLFNNQRLVAEHKDLQSLSQYVDLIFGSLGLYEELHQIFASEYHPNQLHEFFASLPRKMHEKGYPLPFPLIVTTNYDDTLERAFEKASQPYDLVSYIAKGEARGKFLHQTYAGEATVIDRPNEYVNFPFDKYPVILKLYGAVDRSQEEGDNFVITEDHYVDYISSENNLPLSLVNKLLRNHILFMGYDLSNWKLRLILRRIWQDTPLNRCKSWVVCNLHPGRLVEQLWSDRRVAIVERELENYITELSQQINALPVQEEHHAPARR